MRRVKYLVRTQTHTIVPSGYGHNQPDCTSERSLCREAKRKQMPRRRLCLRATTMPGMPVRTAAAVVSS
eukprot:scaffold527159_cov33-Prasinocladus_malaysianus.AAC.1